MRHTPPLAHALFALLAQGALTPLDAVNALEAPDCKCFRDWDSEEGPPPCCPHQAKDHGLDLGEWAGFLEQLQPHEFWEMKTAAAPTDAYPGSEAKIRVMIDRVGRGQHPCRPGDRYLGRLDTEEEEHEEFEAIEFAANGAIAKRRTCYRQGDDHA